MYVNPVEITSSYAQQRTAAASLRVSCSLAVSACVASPPYCPFVCCRETSSWREVPWSLQTEEWYASTSLTRQDCHSYTVCCQGVDVLGEDMFDKWFSGPSDERGWPSGHSRSNGATDHLHCKGELIWGQVTFNGRKYSLQRLCECGGMWTGMRLLEWFSKDGYKTCTAIPIFSNKVQSFRVSSPVRTLHFAITQMIKVLEVQSCYCHWNSWQAPQFQYLNHKWLQCGMCERD